ncbi:5,10-methylenetetrahydrofolate reductase [Candidatus Tremblaya princeps]|uniref:Methylenetetrahydrofolate reductase n=1 Tax=Tremblaya princeps TaxID=189385 RepID=A0A143WNB2_TREPR|nr:5,10-methylenetetrahydrofolate reductase [Candidatus Tremblaya princeps]
MHGLSFEFFAPRSHAGSLRLLCAQQHLVRFAPKFVSVTRSASMGHRAHLDVVASTLRVFPSTAPHVLLCALPGDMSRELGAYARLGVRHLVLLMGDHRRTPVQKGAAELVSLVRRTYGDAFYIDVAAYPDGHPMSATVYDDVRSLARKVRCGANSAITQCFYNPDAYCRLQDELYRLGISVPVTPGIMPTLSHAYMSRFILPSGVDVPSWILKRLDALRDCSASVIDFGEDVARALCDSLAERGATDFHLYTLNDHQTVGRVCQHILGPASAG